MNLELANKVILVTGGAKGIGAGISRTLAEEKAIVCILGRNPTEASEIIAEQASTGNRVESYAVEMTDESTLKKAVECIAASHGRIDGIINNAGVNDSIGLRHSVAGFRDSLEKNLVPCFALVHHALDHLIAARGVIINIGSKCSVTGQGGTSGYAASKGAMNALTREWALDLAKYGIRVNCLMPAEVITPLYERWLGRAPDPAAAREQINKSIPLERRTTTVQEIADAVAFLASPKSSHTTGQLVYVDGGYVHLDRACTQETFHLQSS